MMKKIFCRVWLFFLLVWLFLPFTAARAEWINSYITNLTIQKDGLVGVQEKIVYDFGDENKHGIFRTIPYSYRARGGRFRLYLSDFKVTDENENPVPFTTSNNGSDITIKIGDANTTLSGVHEYDISYTVRRALNFFKDHAELYWNAVGSDWQVGSDFASTTVTLPDFVSARQLTATCYSGEEGSNAQCDSHELLRGPHDTAYGVVYAQQKLLPYHPLTVVIGFPLGLVSPPTWQEKVGDFVRDNILLALPFTIGILMYVYVRQRKKAVDNNDVIIAQYEAPPGFTPSKVGMLYNGGFDDKHVAAEIIGFAVSGYITIAKQAASANLNGKPDYRLTILKIPSDLSSWQQSLWNGLFGGTNNGESVSMSTRSTELYKARVAMEKAIGEQLVEEKLFAKNWKRRGTGLFCLGILLIGALIGIGGELYAYMGTTSIVSIILTIIILWYGASQLPVVTKLGDKMVENIKGLELFLTVTEKDRMQFHNAPDTSPALFEKLLPYAIALGVEKQWATRFESMYTQPPQWYVADTAGNFSLAFFVSNVHTFHSSVSASVSHGAPKGSSASGSSGFGGGFSGGGGGGGGGGSW